MKANLKKQHGAAAIALVDAHRITPKTEGGIYQEDNVAILCPVEHMKEHGNYREREESLDKLKSLMDDRFQFIKMRNKVSNQILAYMRRVDNPNKVTLDFLHEQEDVYNKEIAKRNRIVLKHLKTMPFPIIKAAMDVSGVGPMTVAYLLTYVDIEKARYASSLWAYCGYDKSSHDRYTKGEAGGGNKTLRTALYNTASSMIKCRSVYRDVYDNEKAKLEASERIVKTRNTQGKMIETEWKNAKPSHRHGAAMRKMIKHFLADFWYVWRTLEGLDTRPLYVEEKLGHKGIVRPEERGWVF